MGTRNWNLRSDLDPSFRPSKEFWVTKEGTRMVPAHMETRHIIACANLVARKAKGRLLEAALDAMAYSFTTGGDGAAMAAEEAAEESFFILNHPLKFKAYCFNMCPVLKKLEKVLLERGDIKQEKGQ